MARAACGWFLLVSLQVQVGLAEHPSAPRLLPANTLLYGRVGNARELAEAFQKSAIGRMASDPQIRPLIGHLYGSAAEAFVALEGELGLSLDEVLKIPQGEVCFAVVAPPQGTPVIAVLVDVGSETRAAKQILDRGIIELDKNGYTVRDEKYEGTEVAVIRRGDTELAVCLREQLVIFTTEYLLTKQILDVWDGRAEDPKTLADNEKFTRIMSQSAGLKGEPPQISWFVDPLEFYRAANRGNLGAAAALALLDPLGVTGLKGVGGSVVLVPEGFDSISHVHVLTEEPRKGVLNMIAFQSEDFVPEPWVPDDVASYLTLSWDFRKTYDELEKIYDVVRAEEGALDRDSQQRLGEPLELDFQQDVLNALEGRVTMATWMEQPVKLNGECTILAAKLKDANKFSDTFRRLMTRFKIGEQQHAGQTYYLLPGGRRRERAAEGGAMVRQPQPCMTLLGDYLIASDSELALREVIGTRRSPGTSLADNLEYKLVASDMKRQAGSRKVVFWQFSRPRENFKALYDLANSPEARQRLKQGAERNPALRALSEALEENQLPPFSVVAQYLKPGGSIGFDDGKGLHFLALSFSRGDDEREEKGPPAK